MTASFTAVKALAKTLPQLSSFLEAKPVEASTAGFVLQLGPAICSNLESAAASLSPFGSTGQKGTNLLAAIMCAADAAEMAFDQPSIPVSEYLASWSSLVTTRAVRFCPGCLRVGKPFQRLWLLEPFVACPEHECLLEELAPTTTSIWAPLDEKDPYTWKDFWSESLALDLATKLASRPASPGLIALSSHFKSLVARQAQGTSYSTAFADLRLPDALRLVMFLGRVPTSIQREDNQRRRSGRRVPVARLFAHWAHEALTDWPHGFYKYLEQVKRPPRRTPKISAVWGAFPHYLFKHFSEPQFEFVRKAFVDYLLMTHPGLFDGRYRRALLLGDISRSAFIGASGLAKKLRIDPQVLGDLIRHQTIPGQVLGDDCLSHSRVLIARDDVPTIADQFKKAITMKTAQERLHTSRRHLHALLDSGVIRPLGKGTVERSLILGSEIDRMANLIRDLATASPILADAKSLWKVSLQTGRDAFPRLLSAIFSRELPCWLGPDANREEIHFPRDLLVSRQDVERWRARDAASRSGGMMTVQEAAAFFKEKEEVLYHLVRRGLIPSTMKKVKFREERLVAPTDAVAFFEKYVSPAALNLPTSPTYVVRHMRSHGIEPVAGPDVDGCRKYFFLRAERIAEVTAQFIPRKKGK